MTTQKSLVASFAYWARNLRSRKLFLALKKYCFGDVLDVGGRDFYLTVKSMPIKYSTWTTLERAVSADGKDPRFRSVVGDGCRMDFQDASFDTVLNIQVLEHVFDPMAMVLEISRVLRPTGYGIFLVPQTSVPHELPEHYYNFTRPWIEEAMKRAGLRIVLLEPLGGVWSSFASHLVYFFFQAFKFSGYSFAENRRNIWFFILLPVMTLYALVNIPICLFLSLGDLSESANNYLVVVRK